MYNYISYATMGIIIITIILIIGFVINTKAQKYKRTNMDNIQEEAEELDEYQIQGATLRCGHN